MCPPTHAINQLSMRLIAHMKTKYHLPFYTSWKKQACFTQIYSDPKYQDKGLRLWLSAISIINCINFNPFMVDFDPNRWVTVAGIPFPVDPWLHAKSCYFCMIFFLREGGLEIRIHWTEFRNFLGTCTVQLIIMAFKNDGHYSDLHKSDFVSVSQ